MTDEPEVDPEIQQMLDEERALGLDPGDVLVQIRKNRDREIARKGRIAQDYTAEDLAWPAWARRERIDR